MDVEEEISLQICSVRHDSAIVQSSESWGSQISVGLRSLGFFISPMLKPRSRMMGNVYSAILVDLRAGDTPILQGDIYSCRTWR